MSTCTEHQNFEKVTSLISDMIFPYQLFQAQPTMFYIFRLKILNKSFSLTGMLFGIRVLIIGSTLSLSRTVMWCAVGKPKNSV